jgi:hypothetical protein
MSRLWPGWRTSSISQTALAGLLCLARGLAAQVPLRIDDRPSCEACSIRLDRVATLQGPEVPGEPITGVRLPDGRLRVTFYPVGEEIVEFASSGKFSRILARSGKGPGEVSAARHLERIAGDTLLVFDAGRLQWFDAGGTFVRALPFPLFAQNALYLGAGTLVANAQANSRETFGEPLHLIADYSRLVRSFGAPAGLQFQPNLPYQILRSLTPDGSGGFWAARPTAYTLENYDRTGARTRILERQVDWFQPYWVRAPIGPDAPPPPWLTGIQWLGQGRILVLVHRLKPNWKQFLGPAQQSARGISYPGLDWRQMHWTSLEVVDVVHGRVVVAGRAEEALGGFVDASHVMAYRQDTAGNPFVDIYHIVLVGG